MSRAQKMNVIRGMLNRKKTSNKLLIVTIRNSEDEKLIPEAQKQADRENRILLTRYIVTLNDKENKD